MIMKKIISVILLSLLAAVGNMYAQTYYTGDGGRGITLAVLEPAGRNFAQNELWILPLVQGAFNTNFNRYSAIGIVDRQNLDSILAQQRESLSGNYSENDYVRIGRLANARYILIGTITKTPNGSFMLEFSVSDAEAGRRVASYGPKPFAASALENLSAIQEASADLLDQLGVKLTDAGKRSLLAAADDRRIQAETALSKGIVAQKSGTAVEAFAYYLQAVNYDPASAEIMSRMDTVNADITSSSMGEDIRNAIAWRRAWVGRLSECDQFVAGYARNTPLTTTLVYSADFKQGEIDWEKETIPISVDVCLAPDENWPVPVTGVVNAVYEGFAGTGQAAAWKLDWPLKNAAGRASQVMPSTEVKYNLVLDLLNDKGAVLGRQGVTFTAGWKIEFRNGKSVGVKTVTPQTVTYPAVDANRISETLVIRVASVNGRIVSAASGNSVAVRAITGEDFRMATAGTKPGTLYNGNWHSYEVIHQTMTWTDAKRYCEERGGHLATITSSGEQKFIEDLLARGGDKNMYWLGGYRNGRVWSWVTDEPFVFTNWSMVGHGVSGEDKMQIYRVPHPTYGQFGMWEDDTNGGSSSFFQNTGFICEWD